MIASCAVKLTPRVEQGIHELEAMLLARYPDATFRVSRSPEDRRSVHLVVTVDVDDRDEVMDVVLDRLLELQVKQRLPIHVIPVRPRARTLAMLQARAP